MKRHKVLPNAAGVAVLATGLVVLGGSPAHAESGLGDLLGSGDRLPVDLSPVTGGGSTAQSGSSAGAGNTSASSPRTQARSRDAGSGNRVDVPLSVPVTVCGNSAGALGKAKGGCAGEDDSAQRGTSHLAGRKATDIASDHQVNVPISVPITVCGNAVAVLGKARGDCGAGQRRSAAYAPAARTPGSGGVLAGNRIQASALGASISVPVTICGNAIAGPGGEVDESCGGLPPGEENPPPEAPPGEAPGGVEGPQTGPPSANAGVQGRLPFTGIPLETLVAIAIAFLLAGTGALRLSRVRRSRTTRGGSA